MLTVMLVFLVFAVAYRLYKSVRLENYKEKVVADLEEYRHLKGFYPSSLDSIEAGDKFDMNYSIDSAGNSFYLGYSSGIMDANCNYYKSETKKWESDFTY